MLFAVPSGRIAIGTGPPASDTPRAGDGAIATRHHHAFSVVDVRREIRLIVDGTNHRVPGALDDRRQAIEREAAARPCGSSRGTSASPARQCKDVAASFAPSRRMRILVCNDDGIYSPGIAALAEVASAFGTVRIVAPNVEQSSMGHAITASRPLSFRATRARRPRGISRQRHAGRLRLAWRLQVGQGRPGAVGVQPRFQPWQLDLAFRHARRREAGGAARPAWNRVQRARRHRGFHGLKPWMHRVLDTLIGAAELTLVNVNLPRDPRGLIWTRVSVRQYDGVIVPTKDPMGREVVLVQRHAARRRRRRHRSMGDRAELDLVDAALSRSHRSATAGAMPRAAPAR